MFRWDASLIFDGFVFLRIQTSIASIQFDSMNCQKFWALLDASMELNIVLDMISDILIHSLLLCKVHFHASNRKYTL